MTLLAGIDVGGTKCALTLGQREGELVTILDKRRFATPPNPDETIALFMSHLDEMVAEAGEPLAAIGISCGGPLDSKRGIVLSPPNLPGWINIPIVELFRKRYGVPTALQNDAKAGALAEWRWGAGRGHQHLIFLTFGTGMGSGLILDGRLYTGTNDMGGEVGHLRLSEEGPVGFGKAGSFEGWCSGGGIGRYAQTRARDAILAGTPPLFAPTLEALPDVSAKTVAEAAHAGDALALEVWRVISRRLGQGLALLIDTLNPQLIILGSIYLRQRALIEPEMRRVLAEEAISYSLGVCEIVPPGLGEAVGDYAALAIAQVALEG